MARYIDADKFIERIKVSPAFRNAGMDGYFLCNVVIDLLNNIPTADVVPKSEVEELKAIIADHKASEERWQELYADTVDKWEKAYEELEIELENAKIELTREIFEEIERFLYLHFRFCKEEIGNDDTEYVKGRMELNTQIQNFIAKLKKKYTENKE